MDEASVFILLGVLWVISGAALIALGIIKWDWRADNQALRFIAKLLNQTRIRVFCVALGFAWLVVGILFAAGVIPSD
jgi:hypothetical protein